MIDKKLAEEILEKAKEVFGRKTVLVFERGLDENGHLSDAELQKWEDADRPYQLLFQEGTYTETDKYIAFVECAYGKTCLWKKKEKSLTTRGYHGIVEDKVAALFDYYGFCPPAIFERVK